MAVKRLSDEKSLLKRIAEGDQSAFTKIYNHHYSEIFNYARYLVHSDDYALDIVQETMLHVWQLGDQLPKINNLHGYLRVFTQRRVIDVLRTIELHKKADRLLSIRWQEMHNETEEGIVLNEGRKILEEGILRLPPQQQRVFRLCHQQGLKYDEAASEMNITSATVKTHLKVAMRSLRKYISQYSEIGAFAIIFKLF